MLTRTLIFFLLLSFQVSAQQTCEFCDLVRDEDITNQKNQQKTDSLVRLIMDPYRRHATQGVEVFNKYLKAGDCDCIPNAKASMKKCLGWDSEKRYIFFCSKFMNKLLSNQNKASTLQFEFILAHELAHHLLGHTAFDLPLPSYRDSYPKEFQADGYGLFLLNYKYRREGKTITDKDIEGIFESLATMSDNQYLSAVRTHPALEERKRHALTVKAILDNHTGYGRAENEYQELVGKVYENANWFSRMLEDELTKKNNQIATGYVEQLPSLARKNNLDSADVLIGEALTLSNEKTTIDRANRWKSDFTSAKKRTLHLQLIPVAGLEFVAGKSKNSNLNFNVLHHPVPKFGFKTFFENWESGRGSLEVDWLFASARSDVLWDSGENQKVSAERIKNGYLELRPQINLPFWILRPNQSVSKHNLIREELSFIFGRPFYIPIFDSYQNFAFTENSSSAITSKWRRYQRQDSFFSFAGLKGFISTFNWSIKYSKRHRLGRFASYTASFSTYTKRWIVSAPETSINSRHRVYETNISLYFW